MGTHRKPSEGTKQRPDSSLGLLDLFTADSPIWTVDTLLENHGSARATIYRYVKALVGAGFLAPVGFGYALGPRFVEIDRQIRIADPLLRVAPPVMAKLRDSVAGSQLLCSYYGLRVLCILQDRTDPRITSSFSRCRILIHFNSFPASSSVRNLLGLRKNEITKAPFGERARCRLPFGRQTKSPARTSPSSSTMLPSST